MNKEIYVKLRPMDNGDIEGIYKSYGMFVENKYLVLGFGDKVILRVGNRIIDVFPSRLEIVD